jgi:AhpD family alkylhydroperoxidase
LKVLAYRKIKEGGENMSRKEVYKEMEQTLGLVPGFYKVIPDSTLELEWNLMKRVEMEPGPIPNKYRELIGAAVAAATHCRYCSFFHTEMAKLNGATEAEIEDAIHFAKSVMGWSTYVNGMQIDFEQFKTEVLKASDYVKRQAAKK